MVVFILSIFIVSVKIKLKLIFFMYFVVYFFDWYISFCNVVLLNKIDNWDDVLLLLGNR